MNKAFIFDMDGVIINTEQTWALYEHDFYRDLFGKEIAEKIDIPVGMSLPGIYNVALEYGFTMEREEFYARYDEMAQVIFAEAAITSGLETLISQLKSMRYKIGIVSASPKNWIDMTLAKTTVMDKFDYILSLHDREDLRHKPYPDGFIEAIQYLHSDSENTIILEDSNRGIEAAKASNAFTIGFRQHLLEGYEQTGADIYADTFDEVAEIVKGKKYE